jgi:hypothetical protein
VAISVSTWVWEHSRSRHGARLVLLALADCMNTADGWAWPSNRELQRKTQLTERAVRTAITELAALGELAVEFNAGPGGCNRYRVLTPAENKEGQKLPPAETAPRQDLPPSASMQRSDQTPAETAPPENSAPRQNLPRPPAESAPGTVSEPEVKISPLERSNFPESGDGALFDAESNGHRPQAAKRGRGRPAGQKSADPQFAEWYAAYPVHKSPGDAETAYAKAIRGGVDPQVLLEAAKRYRDEPEVLDGFGKYPATWLNKKCWLDEPTIRRSGNAHRDYRRGGAGDPLDNEDYSRGAIL